MGVSGWLEYFRKAAAATDGLTASDRRLQPVKAALAAMDAAYATRDRAGFLGAYRKVEEAMK